MRFPAAGHSPAPLLAAALALHPGLPARGDLIATDRGGHRVVRITREGWLETIGGTGQIGGTNPLDGMGRPRSPLEVNLDRPMGIAVGSSGKIYLADSFNDRLLAIRPEGKVRPVAGAGLVALEGKAGAGLPDPSGRAARTFLFRPREVALAPDGKLTFTTFNPGRIWQVDGNGGIALLQGREDLGAPGATFSFAPERGAKPPSLGYTTSIAYGPDGTLFLADTEWGLWRLAPSGAMTAIRHPGGAGLDSVSALPHGILVITTGSRMWATCVGSDDGGESGKKLALLAREAKEARDGKTFKARMDAIGRGDFAPAPASAEEARRTRLRGLFAKRDVHHAARRAKATGEGPAGPDAGALDTTGPDAGSSGAGMAILPDRPGRDWEERKAAPSGTDSPAAPPCSGTGAGTGIGNQDDLELRLSLSPRETGPGWRRGPGTSGSGLTQDHGGCQSERLSKKREILLEGAALLDAGLLDAGLLQHHPATAYLPEAVGLGSIPILVGGNAQGGLLPPPEEQPGPRFVIEVQPGPGRSRG